MSRPRLMVFGLVVSFGCLFVGSPDSIIVSAPAPKAVSNEAIKKAIEELGDKRFNVRTKAQQFLWEAGKTAEPLLKAAAKSADPETAERARLILEKFQWGIYPDTPKEIVQLIEQFRGGDEDQRRSVVVALSQRDPPPFEVMRNLIANIADVEVRTAFQVSLSQLARNSVPKLIARGRMDRVSEVLETCLSPGNQLGINDFAAAESLRGKLDEAILRFKQRADSKEDAEAKLAAEVLTSLYRLKKDWPNAVKSARATGNKELLNDLLWEADDWKALAESEVVGDRAIDDSRPEKAGYWRLAGDKKKVDEIIDSLKKDLDGVEGDDVQAVLLAKTLLSIGRPKEAFRTIQEKTKASPEFTFEVLCAQLKYREAFEFAERAIKDLGDDPNNALKVDRLEMTRGRMLFLLGEKERSIQIFRKLCEKVTTDEAFLSTREILHGLNRIGLRELAFDNASQILTFLENKGRRSGALEIFSSLWEDHFIETFNWWLEIRRANPKEPMSDTLNRIAAMMEGRAKKEEVDRLIEALAKEGQKDPDDRGVSAFSPEESRRFAAAELYRRNGNHDKAADLYRLVFNPESPRDEIRIAPALAGLVAMNLGDSYTAIKKYESAASAYRRATELLEADPLPHFLAGRAVMAAGKVEDGKRMIETAHLMSLSDDHTRYSFAERLAKRGFHLESRREMESIIKFSWFRSYQVGNATLRMARRAARAGDHARAADLYDKDIVSLFRTGAVFFDSRAYVSIPELARTYRVRALLSAGKVDEAMAEAKESLSVAPGNVELPIGLIPDLDKSNRKKEADELYRMSREAHESAIKQFPQSPELRNSIAWMMVNCRRDLKTALEHSQKAVELAPHAAGYMDTLAEVHFRLKNKEKALELMKKCLTIEPDSPYFRKQIERFEKGDFNSNTPDEETGDD